MVNGEQHLFHGVHVLGEIYGVDAMILDDVNFLEKALSRGIEASGASLCGIQSKAFEPHGVTILALLSESHASIHTYPEQGSLFFDAFTCGDRCDPMLIAQALIEALKPERHSLTKIDRGRVETENDAFFMPNLAESNRIVAQKLV